MGNCNSESEIKQKCTGCGYKKCDCTAGLDRLCGRCDPSWKYNVPGTYDAQYNAWMAANPRPVKPIFDPQPALNSMDFVCTQCTQCQDFSGITGGGAVSINDPSQVMTCIGKMQDKAAADKAAADKAAADKAAADKAAADKAAADASKPAPATPASPASGNTPAGTAPAPVSNQTMIFAGIAFFMFMFIIIIALMMSRGSRGGAFDKLDSNEERPLVVVE